MGVPYRPPRGYGKGCWGHVLLLFIQCVGMSSFDSASIRPWVIIPAEKKFSGPFFFVFTKILCNSFWFNNISNHWTEGKDSVPDDWCLNLASAQVAWKRGLARWQAPEWHFCKLVGRGCFEKLTESYFSVGLYTIKGRWMKICLICKEEMQPCLGESCFGI